MTTSLQYPEDNEKRKTSIKKPKAREMIEKTNSTTGEINLKDLEQTPIQNEECQSIIDVASERLSCFALLGFDYTGAPVSICVIKSPLQDLALTTFISNFSDKLQMNHLEETTE